MSHPVSPRSRWRPIVNRWRRALPALVAVGVGGLIACSGNSKAKVPAVTTAPVQRQDIVVDVQATGVIAPINAVQVKSKASGQIIKMPVSIGAQVKPGDLLVQIDPRDAQNHYDQAAAALKAAEASQVVADTQLIRENDLFKQGVITATEREAAVLTAANAHSAVVAGRTNLDLAAIALSDAHVVAPIAGTIIEKDVSLGTVISSATASYGGGTTLLVMADLSVVQDSVLVNESDIGNVKIGQKATVKVDAYPNRSFQGSVEKISPAATVLQSVTMFPVFIRLDNRDGALMPGMNSDVSLLVEQRDNVLAVPNDAVRTPRDASAAASALGLDPNTVRSQVQTEMASLRGGRSQSARGDSAGGGSGPPGDPPVAPTDGSQKGKRQARAGAGTTARGTAGGGATPTFGGQELPAAAQPTHTGLVFVAKGKTFEPRVAMLGIGNYDVTEVRSGLQEGEQVALISAALLQQNRTQMVNRIRSRTALPGMSGSTGGTGAGAQQSGGAGGAGAARTGGGAGGGAGGATSGSTGGTGAGGAGAAGGGTGGGGRPSGPP